MPRTKEAFKSMRESTRQKIEAAALSLFARKGLSVTVDEIAQEVYVSKALFYNHYPSKNALIIEFVRRAISISSQNITEFLESDDTAVIKIQKITTMMCQMFSGSPIAIDYFIFMTQVEMSGFQVPDGLWYSDEFPNPIQSFTKILVQGQKEGSVVQGDPLQLSTVYWAAFQGLCCYASTGIPVSTNTLLLNRIVLREDLL